MCLAVVAPIARAADGATEAGVRQAFIRWMEAFNARDSEQVCDLFAPDLAAAYRGVPDRDFAQHCDRVRQTLADPKRRYRHALEIKAILASGDLATAQVVWTLEIRDASGTLLATSVEPSLDIFRRQSDDSWKMSSLPRCSDWFIGRCSRPGWWPARPRSWCRG